MAITAEYTDWARPSQHPLALRDMTAEALHDASLVAPALTAAESLALANRLTFVYVLDNRPRDQVSPIKEIELRYDMHCYDILCDNIWKLRDYTQYLIVLLLTSEMFKYRRII